MFSYLFLKAWWERWKRGDRYNRHFEHYIKSFCLDNCLTRQEAAGIIKTCYAPFMKAAMHFILRLDGRDRICKCPEGCPQDEVLFDGTDMGYPSRRLVKATHWWLPSPHVGLKADEKFRGGDGGTHKFVEQEEDRKALRKVANGTVTRSEWDDLLQRLSTLGHRISAKLSKATARKQELQLRLRLQATLALHRYLDEQHNRWEKIGGGSGSGMLMQHLSTTYPLICVAPHDSWSSLRHLGSARISPDLIIKWKTHAPVIAAFLLDPSNLKQGADWSREEWLCPAAQALVEAVLAFAEHNLLHSKHKTTTGDLKTAETEDFTSFLRTAQFYPRKPIVRTIPQRYEADKYSKSRTACNKFYSRVGSNRHGLFIAMCARHHALIGIHVMRFSESVREVFRTLLTRWKIAPRLVIYDNCAIWQHSADAESLIL
jgi:hypothetical protein